MNIFSKFNQNEYNNRLEKILENKNGDARKGTQITVTNMFYNTPARLKHLSSPYAELAGIKWLYHIQVLSLD